MIEVNLQPTTKDLDITNVGGFNLSLINVKLVILGLIFIYVPEGFLSSYYEGEIQSVTEQLQQINSEQRRASTKLRSLGEIKRQVDELKTLETSLKNRIQVVKNIVNERTNPFKILNYVANNIPKNVWVERIVLDNNDLELYGKTEELEGISSFIQNLKNSIYFDGNVDYTSIDSINLKDDKNEVVESQPEQNTRKDNLKIFKLKTTITSFQ